MKKCIYTSEDNLLKLIEEFNNELNSYDYGISDDNGYINGTSVEDYLHNYRLLSPKEVERLRGGICWDFCQYEDWYFDKHFPEIKTKFFYMIIDNNNDCPTHTFLTFKLGNKFYWFESSWQSNQGLHQYDSEEELLNDAVSKLWEIAPGYPAFYRQYNPKDMNAGMTVLEYMDAMEDGLVEYF